MGYINNSGYYKQFTLEIEKQMENKQSHDFIKDFENKYPELSKQFKLIQKEQYELFAKKMLSYGLGNIAMGSNLDTKEDVNLSLTGIWIRSMDKMQRLKQLVLLNKTNSLDNEPVEDAYIDLSNYSIIALLVKAGMWKK
jgi:hypothetical protein